MALTQAELLDVWRRFLPESYTEPLEIEAAGLGVDVIASIASVFERVAVSIELNTQAVYIYPHSEQLQPPAAGAAQATGTVDLTRAPPTAGDIELYDGDALQTLVTSQDGVDVVEIGLEVDADQTITGGTVGPFTVNVRAARAGHHGNVVESRGRSVQFLRRTTASITGATTTILNVVTPGADSPDAFNDGHVGGFVRFTAGSNIITEPRRVISYDSATGSIEVDGAAIVAAAGTESLEVVDLETLGFTAELSSDMAGGLSGWLDANGLERGKGRNAFESDDTYRERLRYLPDVVAPNSIYRAASRILTPLGIGWELRETRGHDGVDPWPFRGFWVDYDPLDDPVAAPETNERVLLGERFDRQGFIIIVERWNYGDCGAPVDFAPPGGVHPSDAVDWMCFDGYPVGFWADLRRLIEEVEAARMGGVPWLLVLVDTL